MMTPSPNSSWEPSQIFQILRTKCVSVSQDPTVNSLTDLNATLRNFRDSERIKDQNLFKYATFPLELALGRASSLKENVVIETFNCYCEALRVWTLSDEVKCRDIVRWCCKFLSSKKTVSGKESIANISEEFKLAVVNCLKALFIATNIIALTSLFSDSNTPLLGHCISLLLNLSEFEGNRELRVTSLQCICLLTEIHKGKNSKDKDLKHMGDSIAFFLPGISTTVVRVVSGNPKQGHQVSVEAIRMWRAIIRITMDDKVYQRAAKGNNSNEQSDKTLESSCTEFRNEDQVHRKDLKILRDENWFDKAAGNLKILIEKALPVLTISDNPKVKHEGRKLVQTILEHCSKSLRITLPSCVEFLAYFIGDTDENASQESKRILEHANLQMNMPGSESIFEIIEEKLIHTLTMLPRIMHGALDEQKFIILQHLYGYFMLLGNKLNVILSSYCHLENVIKSFLQILELDVSDVKIVEERLHSPSNIPGLSSNYGDMSSSCSMETEKSNWKRFRCIQNEKVSKLISTICQELVKHTDTLLLFDYTMELFKSSAIYRNQAGMLMTEFIYGLQTASSACPEFVADQLITLYMHDEYWHAPTQNIMNTKGVSQSKLLVQLERSSLSREDLTFYSEGIPVETLNCNIHLICIMMEGIQACSILLKKEFQVYLIRTLYALLEKAGDENALINHTAYSTLHIISNAFGLQSLEDLVAANADYVVDVVSYNFRHLRLFSTAPVVLIAMLRCSNAKVIPIIADILQEVYVALDRYKDDISYLMMGVLQELNKAVNIWFTDHEVDTNHYQKERPLSDNKEKFNLKTFFEDKCRDYAIALGKNTSEDLTSKDSSIDHGNEKPEDETPDAGDEKKEVPLHYQVVITAVEKCIHFLNTKDIPLKQRILEVIKFGVLALRRNENELLPLIHKLWSSLTYQLQGDSKVIILKTIEVVRTMVICSKDFMRQRLKKDFIPRSCRFLEDQSTISLTGGTTYKFSLACKVQVELLTFFTETVPHLDIRDEDLNQLFASCSSYLSSRQPLVLQKASVALVRVIQRMDQALVWYGLMCLYDFEKCMESKQDGNALSTVVNTNEFSHNVLDLVTNNS